MDGGVAGMLIHAAAAWFSTLHAVGDDAEYYRNAQDSCKVLRDPYVLFIWQLKSLTSIFDE